MKIEDIPTMPGYVSVARAAKIFGMSKASIFYKIYEQEAFRHVYRLAGAEDHARPVLLLLESEVYQVAAREREEARTESFRARLNHWNKRVKQWGRETGWTRTEIHTAGQPHRLLQQAYLAVHPDDRRPD